MDLTVDLYELSRVVFSYPAIDNHAHPFLREEFRDTVPFEGLITEADGEQALHDATHTMACYRATAQLAKLYGLGAGADWEAVKRFRSGIPYEQLCRACMDPTRIQCILIDDGLGSPEKVYPYRWHDHFTPSPSKRIVRVEAVAEDILKKSIQFQIEKEELAPSVLIQRFVPALETALRAAAADPEVAGFKSIACYRTGLDVGVVTTLPDDNSGHEILTRLSLIFMTNQKLRLAHKSFNDYIVNVTMRIAGEAGKPVQFHTGLGDNDITLTTSSPAQLQTLIKAYSNTKIVLLHSSYPYTKEAGYLTSVYENVFLDFGEIFPFLSPDGQRQVVREVLELAPTNKIMWSTDGHYWPESYYLGSLQARQVLYEVLESSVRRGELALPQAIGIVKRAFFENANRIYNLGLEPHII
ncbi:amidohydrolase-domain-containing protein [Lenzites betulinus]|nr:amidohydrolase-domain-containing protein [Lenzites betulinus]